MLETERWLDSMWDQVQLETFELEYVDWGCRTACRVGVRDY